MLLRICIKMLQCIAFRSHFSEQTDLLDQFCGNLKNIYFPLYFSSSDLCRISPVNKAKNLLRKNNRRLKSLFTIKINNSQFVCISRKWREVKTSQMAAKMKNRL